MPNDLFPEAARHDHGCKVKIRIPTDWFVEATFDGPNDCYRTKLLHKWGRGPTALIAMMNPSGADWNVGDQTVMKTSRIFRRLGYGGQWIGNACAYRHVSPRALLAVEDPVGPKNIPAILEMAAQSHIVVVAHGRLPGRLQRHATEMCEALLNAGHDLHVLALTASGVPMHPLARGKGFIAETIKPTPWKKAAHARGI
jgi:hypothetical protein